MCKRNLLTIFMLVLVGALALAACAPAPTPVPPPTAIPTVASTAVPATKAPAPTAVPATAPAPTTASTTAPPTASSGSGSTTTLTVLAAASLTDSFKEIGAAFEKANAGVKVTFSFAGSQALRTQIQQGAKADVFASADNNNMDPVKADNLLGSAPQIFTRNVLTVITPKANPAGVKELKDLTKAGLKLVVADASVPVGNYTLQVLDKLSADPAYGSDFKTKVLANVVSKETDVKAVVSKVSLGEGDAGVVYTTDAQVAADKLTTIAIPDQYNVIATYPIATLKTSANPALAQKFVDFVSGTDGQATLKKYGFAPLAPTASPTVAPTTAASGSSTGGSFTVTDALTRTVKFDKTPQRIVMAGKAYFMVADATYLFPEAKQRVVAFPGNTSGSQGSGNFMAVVDPTLGTKTLFTVDVGAEQIAPLKPDVVILKSVASKLGDTLEKINIPVVYVDLETPAQYQRDLAILGKVFGNPDRAQKLAAYYQGIVDRLGAKVKNLKDSDKPKVLLLQYAEKSGTVAFSVPPVGWIQTTIVDFAGGNAVWKSVADPSGWAVVNLEQIASWNPDMVFVISYFGNPKDAVTKIKADPKWAPLQAVKSGKIYAFPTDFYSWDQPDTRWGLGLEWLATKIQPALFSDINITQEISQFYALYGLDQATIQSKVNPLLQGDLP